MAVPLLVLAQAAANTSAYAREAVIASLFGATSVTDAYFVATLVPTIVSAILVSNSLVPVLLPSLARELDDHRRESRLVGVVLVSATLVLCVITSLGLLMKDMVLRAIVPAWSDSQSQLAGSMLQIALPSIIPLGLAAILGSVSNAHHRYLAPPIGLTTASIVAIAATLGLAPILGVLAPAWGVLLGSTAHLAVQAIAVMRLRIRIRFHPHASHGLLSPLVAAYIPIVIHSCLAQSLPLLERLLASGLPPGQLSHLSYAAKLYLIPITILGSSSVLVSFVTMSRVFVREDSAAFAETLTTASQFTGFLMATCAVGVGLLAEPLVTVAFGRGEFGDEAIRATARLLAIYALGIVPSSKGILLARSCQARGDNAVLLLSGMMNTGIYLAAALALFGYWGLYGLAVAFVISQVTGSILLHLLQPVGIRPASAHYLRREGRLLLLASLVFVSTSGMLASLQWVGLTLQHSPILHLAAGLFLVLAMALGWARVLRMAEGRLLEGWFILMPSVLVTGVAVLFWGRPRGR